MAADQILIICDGEFSFGSMLASYIRFYSIDQFQPVVITLHQQHLHPLAVQVMSEDGIDISECKPLNINKIKNNSFRVAVHITSQVQSGIPEYIHAEEVIRLQYDEPVRSTHYNEVVLAYRQTREAIKTSGIELVGQWQQVLV